MRKQEKRFRNFRKVRNVTVPVMLAVFILGVAYAVFAEMTSKPHINPMWGLVLLVVVLSIEAYDTILLYRVRHLATR